MAATPPDANLLLLHLTTDPGIVGVVGWVSLLVGLLSLAVTLGGFWLALVQIRKVQSSSAAAQEAVAKMTRTVQSREQSAKLAQSISSFRSAGKVLKLNNFEATVAYVDVGCTFLVEARQLCLDETERDRLTTHIQNLRRSSENLEHKGSNSINVNKLKALTSCLSLAINDAEELAAKLHYDFTQDGRL